MVAARQCAKLVCIPWINFQNKISRYSHHSIPRYKWYFKNSSICLWNWCRTITSVQSVHPFYILTRFDSKVELLKGVMLTTVFFLKIFKYCRSKWICVIVTELLKFCIESYPDNSLLWVLDISVSPNICQEVIHCRKYPFGLMWLCRVKF